MPRTLSQFSLTGGWVSMDNNNVSIGTINTIAYDPVSDRSKGFITDLQDTAEGVARILEEIGGAHRQGTRLTVRLPLNIQMNCGLVAHIRVPWKEHAELACEAMIPVHRHGLGAIAYFGANMACRRSEGTAHSREWGLLEETGQCLHLSPPRVLPPQFSVEILRHLSDDDLGCLEAIYRASFESYITDLSRESIAAMTGKNITAVVRNQAHDIVAVSQAEIASFSISDEPWRLIELSETATDPAYRSIGLSQFCKSALIKICRRTDAIIYAESRANHPPVLRSNQKVGFRPRGRLDQHCLMDSSAKDFGLGGTFANLFVFSL